jgi:hypothetical protein
VDDEEEAGEVPVGLAAIRTQELENLRASRARRPKDLLLSKPRNFTSSPKAVLRQIQSENVAHRSSSVMTNTPRTCPHCGTRLSKWLVPVGASWPEEFFWVCFNNDCSYYKEGWDWMMEQYSQTASYRFAVNPTNGATLMIPVWSDAATREMIVEEPEGGQP